MSQLPPLPESAYGENDVDPDEEPQSTKKTYFFGKSTPVIVNVDEQKYVRRSSLKGREGRLLYFPWDAHIGSLEWEPGEHTIVIGPTGKGKSTLVTSLLVYRELRNAHVLVIATKAMNSFSNLTPDSPFQTQRQLESHPRGYYLTPTWKMGMIEDHQRIVLWVPYIGTGSVMDQRNESEAALQDVMSQGGFTVYIDELRWFVDRMKLKDWVVDLWTQGRELGISAIGSTQRPVWVTRDVYANSTHFYIWGTEDEEDLRRLGGIGGMDNKAVRRAVASLQGHNCLYINAKRKIMYVTKAPNPKTGRSDPPDIAEGESSDLVNVDSMMEDTNASAR